MKNIIKFYKKNIITKLVFINIIVYIIEMFMSKDVLKIFLIPINISEMIQQPWSLLSGMFMHESLSHLFFNFLWFIVFANILIKVISEKQFLKLYLYSGIGISILISIIVNLINSNITGYMLGASAAISTIVFAAIYYNPNEKINIVIFEFKIVYFAYFLIITDLINLLSENKYGHLAHLIGYLIGYIYIKKIQNKKIISDIFKFNF